ncbi:MAG: hypothetical protein R2788_26170 [Saprospiraceae bacterium]
MIASEQLEQQAFFAIGDVSMDAQLGRLLAHPQFGLHAASAKA